MKTVFRKTSAILLALSILFSIFIQICSANTDKPNHWAAQVITKWRSLGLIQGRGNGSIEPDSFITRAEFAALIDRVFGLPDASDITFIDVPEDAWYSKPVSKLAAAGIVVGNNGRFRPHAFITRQEAAVILYRAFEPDVNDSDIIKEFKDYEEIASWGADAVSALYGNGYVKGRSNKMFAPAEDITRAETIVMIDNIMGGLKNEPGTYTINMERNLVVNTADVKLRNIDIPGNLYITQGVGRGKVELENVTVHGDVIILGGGEVVFSATSVAGTLKAKKTDGRIDILARGNSDISNVQLSSAALLQEESITGKGFETVHITQKIASKQKLVFDGIFANVFVEAPEASLHINHGRIEHLELAETPEEANISIEGGTMNVVYMKNRGTLKLEEAVADVLTLSETSESSKVNLSENTEVETLFLYAKAHVTGSGKVKKAHLYVSDASLEQRPDVISFNGHTAMVAGKAAGTVSGADSSPSNNKPNPVPTASPTANPTPVPTTKPIPVPTTKPTLVPTTEPIPAPELPHGPVITLTGKADISICINGNYSDQGATATDAEDGNITSSIVTTITNNVNDSREFSNTVPATYTFRYSVTDKDGNNASVTRKVTVKNAVCITDFGAHSIDEPGYDKFNSAPAINAAIRYAEENNIPTVDFGGKPGVYYAMDVSLAGGITYINTNKAELRAVGGTPAWRVVLKGREVKNATLDGIIIDGNMLTEDNPNGVDGNDQEGVALIRFDRSQNIKIQNCYLHDNWYSGIILSATEYAEIKNNKIENTDCGIITVHEASNHLLIEGNEIFGTSNQWSEPISIYNDMSEGYAHDIIIRGNKCYDKTLSNGIMVMNAHDVLIEKNEVFNCCIGISLHYRENEKVLPFNIVIQENNLHDNIHQGMLIAARDSKIINNKIHNENRYGIFVSEGNGLQSENLYIANNTITNFNSLRTDENQNEAAGILIKSGNNCVIENNTFSDTRKPGKTCWIIQITGNSSNNIVESNNIMSDCLPEKYEVYIQKGTSNIVKGGYKLLDQASQTIVINNSSESTGKADPETKTITAGEAHNTYGKTSDIITINQNTKTAYNRISPSWVGRQLTVKIAKVGTTTIVPGGNINLKDQNSFIPAAPNATITFVYDGTMWNEVFRNPNGVEYLDVSAINSVFADISTPDDLPKKVTVTLSDGSKRDFPIDWLTSFPAYKSAVKGTYVFVGRPVLPENITNTTNKMATVKVVVTGSTP